MTGLVSKSNALWCFLMFWYCCHGLSPPHDLNWSINGAHVHVTWKHSHTEEPLNGYYVSVQQEQSQSQQLNAPDFVHLDKSVRSSNIQGLLPDATYQIKVVAYSGEVHRSSSPITVKTKGLELLQARNLTITGISTTGALFQWVHDARHTIHDTQFKLYCRGVRQYIDKTNKLVEESDDFEYASYASSQGRESYFSNTLQPNTKYTCHISTVAETVEGPPTQDVTFRTAFGVPTPPPKPNISVHHNSSFTVTLYHSDERFGPISHYKLFAVPMKKETDLPIDNRFIPLVPPSKLLTSAVSPQLLQSHELDPAPFLVGTYKFRKLPRSINFNGDEMRLSFKPKTHYSFVTAVFTQTEEKESEGLHSFSAPADPPVFISTDLQEDWIQQHKPVAKHFTIIVTCTMVSVTLLFAAAFLSAFASNYYQGKKRDAYFFTVADSDSSEDEIYSKTNPTSKSSRPSSSKSTNKGPSTQEEIVPLLTQSPQAAPAPVLQTTDLSESQTYYNPAFEDDAYPSQHTNQPTPQQPVFPVYGHSPNSPAKVPVSSIHNSPQNIPPHVHESPSPDIQHPVVYQIKDYLLRRSESPSPLSLDTEQMSMPTHQLPAGPSTYQEQLLPSADTPLATTLAQTNDDTKCVEKSIVGSSMQRPTHDPSNPQVLNLPIGATRYRGFPSPKSYGQTEYATLQLRDVPDTNTDDYSP